MKKVALITGGSRGIGATTAQRLAKDGYAICISYLSSEDKALKLKDQINNAGGHAIAIKADIAKETDILRLFDETRAQLGPITALINNAGINGGISTVEDVTSDCLQNVFATNVFSTFLCSKEAIKDMKKLHGGSIVNISSEAAKFGGNKLAHYAASKAAVNTFTIALAREVAEYNIRVNTVSPGVIDTEIHHQSSPERLSHLLNTLPMKRMGKTEEVAELIAWLLSDAASYVSGSIIPITGAR